jgi:hypothetical protein
MATALATTPPQYRRVTGRAPKLPRELRTLAPPRPAIPGQEEPVTLAEVEESHEYVRAVKRLRSSSCKIEVEATLHDLQVKTAYLDELPHKTAYLGELPRIDLNL